MSSPQQPNFGFESEEAALAAQLRSMMFYGHRVFKAELGEYPELAELLVPEATLSLSGPLDSNRGGYTLRVRIRNLDGWTHQDAAGMYEMRAKSIAGLRALAPTTPFGVFGELEVLGLGVATEPLPTFEPPLAARFFWQFFSHDDKRYPNRGYQLWLQEAAGRVTSRYELLALLPVASTLM
jgi:hypothetical protein